MLEDCGFPRYNPPIEDDVELSSTCWLVNQPDGKGGCLACRRCMKKETSKMRSSIIYDKPLKNPKII